MVERGKGKLDDTEATHSTPASCLPKYITDLLSDPVTRQAYFLLISDRSLEVKNVKRSDLRDSLRELHDKDIPRGD